MLQIGVHHSQVGRGICQHSFDAGRRQSTPSDPLQHAYIGGLGSQRSNMARGPVARIIVDKDRFPLDARQGNIQTFQ